VFFFPQTLTVSFAPQSRRASFFWTRPQPPSKDEGMTNAEVTGWDRCEAETDCRGIKLESYDKCLRHLQADQLTSYLRGLRQGGTLDGRGVLISRSLPQLYGDRTSVAADPGGWVSYSYTQAENQETAPGRSLKPTFSGVIPALPENDPRRQRLRGEYESARRSSPVTSSSKRRPSTKSRKSEMLSSISMSSPC
jgi:hypothetical protein